MIEKEYTDPVVGKVVFRKSTRCRRVGIRVHPVRGVTVSVPWMMRMDDGMRFYIQKRDWVISVLERQAAQQRRKENLGFALGPLASGSRVRTLMSEILLSRDMSGTLRNVHVVSEPVCDVREQGRMFLDLSLPLYRKTVTYPDTMPQENSPELASALRNILADILGREARALLPEKLAFLAGRYGFVYNRVAVKHNSSNWGSCSSKGNINLNLNLVRLPEPLCDYVLLHELCHLKHPDHGRDFHSLLEQLCADNVRRRKALVDEFAASPAGKGFSDKWMLDFMESVSVSRSSNPVHHVMEQDIRQYRLL